MSDGAPVCLLPNQSQATPSMPGRLFPPIPAANDLPSAIQAINSIRRILNMLTGPRPQFVETGRVTQKVKVINPDDDTQFVIVERINQIAFKDSLTGATMVWKR